MKITIKSKTYLVILIGISIGNCFAGDNPHQPGGYGVLPLGVERLPIDNSGLQQYQYQSAVLQQTQTEQFQIKEQFLTKQQQEKIDEVLTPKSAEAESLKERTEKLKTQPLQQSKIQKYNNASGITEDKMANYCNSTYLSHSFFKNIVQPFSRCTNNSFLLTIRCGNRYKNRYQENNKNSSLLELSFFNTYEQDMTIYNTNSSRISLSIGDVVYMSGDIDHGNDTNSTNFCIPVSRKSLTLLGITAIAYKSGLLSILLSGGTIIPKIVLGNNLLIFASLLIPTTVLATLTITIFFARNFKIR